MAAPYSIQQPVRADIDALSGPAVIEFGTDWCGFCRAAQPLITTAFTDYPQVQQLKVEDGKGRPLGRSFAVRLWPTLIFLKNGQEVARLTRPDSADDVRAALAQIV
jgi:thioredoxin 1